MSSEKVYDIIGIGIGPFNLGLAALCHKIPNLSCLFIDQNENFNWHAGMMIPGTRLQVPFYADLVTLVDPCSSFSYLSFLKAKKKMFRFAIQEAYCIKRTEYNEYCRWVVGQLNNLQFSTPCLSIEKENLFYKVFTPAGSMLTKNLVLGTGTVPFIPEFAKTNNENIFHSADYLHRKDQIKDLSSVTIVGSGQSAAEIFYDLMQCYPGQLNWFTRSSRFFPMDYSKLNLEFSTPDYIDHFYAIPDRIKQTVLTNQDELYKGINASLITEIYNQLVEIDDYRIQLNTNCELIKITEDLNLTFRHLDLGRPFEHKTDALILATGYHTVVPNCIKPLKPFIQLDKKGNYKANRNYSIDESNSIFIQNAEQCTHGFNAADLSLGPYRNAVILNTILGYEYYAMETGNCFQTFGLP